MSDGDEFVILRIGEAISLSLVYTNPEFSGTEWCLQLSLDAVKQTPGERQPLALVCVPLSLTISPARSNGITLNEDWQQIAFVADHQQRTVLFYHNGVLVGKDWFDLNLVSNSTDLEDSLMGFGGFSPSNARLAPSYWLERLEVRDLAFYANYTLLPESLAVRGSVNDLFCNNRYHEVTDSLGCIPKPSPDCPKGTAFDYRLNNCVPRCPDPYRIETENYDCECGPGYYEIWSNQGAPVSGLLMTLSGSFKWSEIRFISPDGSPIVMSDCIVDGNRNCKQLFDEVTDTAALEEYSGKVEIFFQFARNQSDVFVESIEIFTLLVEDIDALRMSLIWKDSE